MAISGKGVKPACHNIRYAGNTRTGFKRECMKTGKPCRSISIDTCPIKRGAKKL